MERNDGCSPREHGAPWNEGNDGECECSSCRKRQRDIDRADFLIDQEREEENGKS